MNVGESVQFAGIGAVNTAAFSLRGGRYGLAQNSTGSGTVTLQILSLDGTTWITALTALATTASYTAGVDLPQGQYRFSIATFTANYLSLTRIQV